jgi:hypothetical protein
LKIVADVKVRRAIVIEIVKHGREAHIPRNRAQRLAIFVQEISVGPTDWRKFSLAIVSIKHVGFAQFIHDPVDDFHPVGVPAGDHRLPVHRANAEGPTGSENGGFAVVGHVEVEVSIAIDVRQSHGGGAGA